MVRSEKARKNPLAAAPTYDNLRAMTFFRRLLILWLLVLMLPLQGLAAVLTAECPHSQPAQPAQLAHCEEMARPGASANSVKTDLVKHGAVHCLQTAACCGIALLPSLLPLSAASGEGASLPAYTHSFDSVASRVPEHPPKFC